MAQLLVLPFELQPAIQISRSRKTYDVYRAQLHALELAREFPASNGNFLFAFKIPFRGYRGVSLLDFR
jgi:hypothetical protein